MNASMTEIDNMNDEFSPSHLRKGKHVKTKGGRSRDWNTNHDHKRQAKEKQKADDAFLRRYETVE